MCCHQCFRGAYPFISGECSSLFLRAKQLDCYMTIFALFTVQLNSEGHLGTFSSVHHLLWMNIYVSSSTWSRDQHEIQVDNFTCVLCRCWKKKLWVKDSFFNRSVLTSPAVNKKALYNLSSSAFVRDILLGQKVFT